MRMLKKTRAIKTVAVLFVTGIILFSSFTSVLGSTDLEEVYDYELKYRLYVPFQYSDNMVDIGTGVLNIQFNENVYFSLKVEEYYKSLSKEDRGDYSSKDYTIGNEVLDDTYNDPEFVTEYFNKKLNSILGKKRVVYIREETINESDFWVCNYVIYTDEYNAETQATQQVDKGEGKMYMNMTSGILYFFFINSNNGLLSQTPDAVTTAESFTIGNKSSAMVYVIWGIIIIAIIAFIVILNDKLKIFSLEVEDDEGHTIVLTGIKEGIQSNTDEYDEYREYEARKAKRATENTVSLKSIRDIVQSKTEQKTSQPLKTSTGFEPTADFDEEEQRTNNLFILNKLDSIMGRLSKNNETSAEVEQAAEADILQSLDIILGRIKPYEPEPESVVTQPQPEPVVIEYPGQKSNEELYRDLDSILGREQA